MLKLLGPDLDADLFGGMRKRVQLDSTKHHLRVPP